MVSVNAARSNYAYNLSFGKAEKIPRQNYAEDFIETTKQYEKKDVEGNFIKRNFGSLTSVIPMLMLLGYEFFVMFKTKKLKKILPQKELAEKSIKYTRNILISFAAAIAAAVGINRYQNSKSDENYNKLKNKFNTINTQTDAKLADKMLYSNYVGALYNPISGKIQLNKNEVNDTIRGRKIEKLVKHELVHAKQYEMVARSKDGIKKINYGSMNSVAKEIGKNQHIKEWFDDLYKDVISNQDKYKNTKVRLIGGTSEVDLTKYVTAIHILTNNPKAGINDIPIVIDAEHYQKVIDKKPALTKEEEAKANEYYKAILNYKKAGFSDVLNPFSAYHQSILELEAYKENPSIITRIAEKHAGKKAQN